MGLDSIHVCPISWIPIRKIGHLLTRSIHGKWPVFLVKRSGNIHPAPLIHASLSQVFFVKWTVHVCPIPLMILSRFSNGQTLDGTVCAMSCIFLLDWYTYYPVPYMINDQLFSLEINEIRSKIGLTKVIVNLTEKKFDLQITSQFHIGFVECTCMYHCTNFSSVYFIKSTSLT